MVLLRRFNTWDGGKIIREMPECAHDGIGRETAERTERTEFHGFAEVCEECRIFLRLDAERDPVHRLDAACGADATGRALAAAFDGAEFEREPGLMQHIGGIVENHDAGMADQATGGREGFIVEDRVEQRNREIGPERTAHLHRLDRAAGDRAATDIIYQLPERQAEGGLIKPAMPDVSGKLDGNGAMRAADAEIASAAMSPTALTSCL